MTAAPAPTPDILTLLQQPHTQVEMMVRADGSIECLEQSFTERRRDRESEAEFVARIRTMLQPGDRMVTPANGRLDHVRIVRAPAAPSAWAELYQLLRRLPRLLALVARIG